MKMIFGIILLVISTISPLSATTEKGEEAILAHRYEEAFAILGPRAEAGDRRALYILGITYLFTDDEAMKDEKKGLELLYKSANQGYGPAYNGLGDYYLEHGDEKMAFQNYKKSADFGFGPGQFNVGIMYKNGKGTPRDANRAYYYLCLASVNHRDLDKVSEDAGYYRDQVVPEINPHERQEILRIVSDLARPNDPGDD